jgi:branched-chain amino acid transport system substrate-binding protein
LKAVLLYINTDYGVGYKDIIANKYGESGGTLLLVDAFDQGTTDFRAQLAKVKPLSPELVFVLGNPKEVGFLLKQARELGLKSQFVANNVEGPDVLSVAGKAAEGLVIVLPYFDPAATTPKVSQFAAKYQQKYGRVPDLYGANGYDAVYMLKAAIEAKGFTGPQMKEGLYALKDFEGVNGKVSFDKNGDVVMPLAYKQVKDGKFVVVN